MEAGLGWSGDKLKGLACCYPFVEGFSGRGTGADGTLRREGILNVKPFLFLTGDKKVKRIMSEGRDRPVEVPSS